MVTVSKDRFNALLQGTGGGIIAGIGLSGFGILVMIPSLALLWGASSFFFSAFLWGALAVLVSHSWLLHLHPLMWIGVPEFLSLPIVVGIWLCCGVFGGGLVGLWAVVGKWFFPFLAKEKTFLGNFSYALFMSSLWGLCEVFLSGSPFFWIGLGISLFPGDLALAGLARWFGAGGLAAIELLLGWWVLQLFVAWRRGFDVKRMILIGILFLQLAHVIGWKLLTHSAPIGVTKVGIWQPAIPTREKFSIENLDVLPGAVQNALEQAEKLKASFLVAPEGTLPIDQKLLSPAPISMLSGGFHWKFGKQRSSLLVFEKGETIPSLELDKHRLVPLGEWIPEIPGFYWSGLSAVGGIEAGSASRFLEWRGPNAAVAICYEIANGHLLAKAVNDGGQWIIAAANLDPYPELLQKQFLSLARLRSIETARDLLTVTNTGPSAHILASGGVLPLLDPFKAGINTTDLNLYRGRTGYILWHEIPLVASMLIGAFFMNLKRLPA